MLHQLGSLAHFHSSSRKGFLYFYFCEKLRQLPAKLTHIWVDLSCNTSSIMYLINWILASAPLSRPIIQLHCPNYENKPFLAKIRWSSVVVGSPATLIGESAGDWLCPKLIRKPQIVHTSSYAMKLGFASGQRYTTKTSGLQWSTKITSSIGFRR